MGMSNHVLGVRDLDGRFAKMMAAKLACDAASVGYPDEIYKYFKCPGECEDYLRQEMESVDITDAVSEYSKDEMDIFEVDLSKLPEGVKAVRFKNSY